MPRALRIHVPGAFYHVTLRGNHRQPIFFHASDRQLLNTIFAEVIDRFSAQLHAYCWMTNHIHALLQVSEAPLGRLMLRIAGQYARTIQKNLQTTGHLFEKRYHAILVDADEYLLELIRYIHLNPVRAGVVDSPEQYPWSGHHAYLGRRQEPWLTTGFSLAMLHPDPTQAIAAYARFMNCEVGAPVASPFVDCNPSDRRILGSDDFAGRMLGESWRPRSRKTLEQLVADACAMFGVSSEQLTSSSRRQPLAKVRAWVAQQAVTQRIASLAAVSRRFHRDESTLRKAMTQHFNSP
jgi:REP element-mobilizing transposase RayT